MSNPHDTAPHLLPCPMCGKSCAVITTSSEMFPDYDDESAETYAVMCDASIPGGPGGCGASGGFAETEARATDKWNRREVSAASGPLSEREQHPDDAAVDRFAAAMKAKMAEQRDKGYCGWDDREDCPAECLRRRLVEHLAKGDPVDVGNFAMMLFNRGEATAADQPPPEPWMAATSKDVEAALLFALWHHQGGSSKIGQPIRSMLSIGRRDHMTDDQLEIARRVQSALSDMQQAAQQPSAAREPSSLAEERKKAELPFKSDHLTHEELQHGLAVLGKKDGP